MLVVMQKWLYLIVFLMFLSNLYYIFEFSSQNYFESSGKEHSEGILQEVELRFKDVMFLVKNEETPNRPRRRLTLPLTFNSSTDDPTLVGLVVVTSELTKKWPSMAKSTSTSAGPNQIPHFENLNKSKVISHKFNSFKVKRANISGTNTSTRGRIPCHARYPTADNVKTSNGHWQIHQQKTWTLYLFSAFYDNREKNKKFPDIRILAVANSFKMENQSFFCQLWFTEFQNAQIVKATPIYFLWPWKKQIYWKMKTTVLSMLISCPLRNVKTKNSVPFAVSIVSKKCNRATNKLVVHYQSRPALPSFGFGVCVKPLDFPEHDISFQLVEWFELLRLLGVEKIHMYFYAVHSNTRKVLEHYLNKGFITLDPYSLPGNFTNDPVARHLLFRRDVRLKRHLEILPYNDCLYRYGIYRYKYLSLLDIDEVIIPLQTRTWPELFTSLKVNGVLNQTANTFQVKQTGCFFHGVKLPIFPGIPKTMHMLQHIYKIPPNKTQKFGVGTKAFLVTQHVVSVFNHYPTKCLFKKCQRVNLNETVVQLQHYKSIRRHCNGPSRQSEGYHCDSLSCLNNTVLDKTLWKYKKKLIPIFQKSILSIFSDHPPTQWTAQE